MFDVWFKRVFKILNERLFSSNYQIQRLIILLAFVLVGVLVMFGGYYYVDRYYSGQQTVKQQTLQEAEQAVRDDPQNPDKRLTLAEAYMFYQRWDDALAQASQVRNAYPDDVRVDFVLGISYAHNGRPQDAIEPLKKYIDSLQGSDMLGLNTRYQAALYFLGDSYLQLGRFEDAIPPLEEGMMLSRTDSDVMYKLGVAYNGVGEYEKAIQVLNRAITFVPDYTEAYEAMVVSFEALNQPVFVKYARGMIAYSKKDYQAAQTLLLEATQERPDYVPGLVGLGQTYEAQNDLQNAKAAFESALQYDPNNFTASNGVQRVTTLLNK